MSKFIQPMMTVLALLVTASVLYAGQTDRLVGVLEEKIPHLMEAEHVPGLSMVLIRDNRIVWKGTFGVRAAGQPDKVDEKTIFEAASMSKPVYTYAVLKQVEEGKFDLDRPLDEYLAAPYLPDVPASGTITARMVMLHRTGLPNWRKKGESLTLKCEPNTRFTYSGEGYQYLQTAVERLTGRPMSAWTEKTLFEPFGMTDSSYVWKDSLKDHFAAAHDKEGKLKKNKKNFKQANAAFSLYTTPTDYARFLIEMMKTDRSGQYSLKSDMIEKMTTLQVRPEEGNERSCRCLGWVKNGAWVNHSGSNGGFRCKSRFNRDTQSGCVIMTNSDSGCKVWEEILNIIDVVDVPGESTTYVGKAQTWAPVDRTVRYDYRVMNPTSKASGKIDVNVPLPFDSRRQDIHYLHLPQTGLQQVYTDVHGQTIAQYSFDGLEPGECLNLGFVVGVTIRNIKCDTTKPSEAPDAIELTPQQRERYLTSEANYSMESDYMRGLAAELTRDATSDYEKLAKIHDYIITKIRYVRDDIWEPAEVVLTRGTGSCSEYNYVLSGLCRLAGLPTRCVGGTSNSFNELPMTDTVYHRWTEVFLDGYGWFPADCSRDANPIRGKRGHFGRVYTDALMWCRQAGGNDDTLGWDYRAAFRIQGENPGLKDSHRTRWFEFCPEQQVEEAYAWFLGQAQTLPEADPMECALVHWNKASVENREKMIRALASAGRNECLRWIIELPKEEMRSDCARDILEDQELADTLLEKSQNPWKLRSWFNDNESKLVAAQDGRFKLTSKGKGKKIPVTTASSGTIWKDLAAEIVDQMADSGTVDNKKIVVMPVVDQTIAGLGEQETAIHVNLKKLIEDNLKIKLIDEGDFDRAMEEKGPGSREYWILSNGEKTAMPSLLVPDIVFVPLCITENLGGEEETVRYHLEMKSLQLSNKKYTKFVARTNRRRAETGSKSNTALLVAGGDTVLARWEHDFVSRNDYDRPLAGIKSVLSKADFALCNLECCVSLRGKPADKGENCPFFYRTRPEMLQCLTSAGIDIVTAANNHSGDYGPLAVSDTVGYCNEAGLVCVGIGETIGHAEQPALVQIGTVKAAIVGMDTTMSYFAAGQERPGSNYVSESELEVFEKKIKKLSEWAQNRCDLLILTIHWGDNWVKTTQPVHRQMARIAFENGVDLILGHSAHQLQGVEVIDGKVVVYDMGNLLFDCELKPEGKQSALFRVHLSDSGVQQVDIVPALAEDCHTVLAKGKDAQGVLDLMDQLCSSLGTEMCLNEDLEGRPFGVIKVQEPAVTPKSKLDPKTEFTTFPNVRQAIVPAIPVSAIVSELPKDADIVAPSMKLIPETELLGFRLPETAAQGGIMHLSTWWRVVEPVGRNKALAFRFVIDGRTPRRGTPWYTRHDAADWTAPLSLLKPGQIVEDNYPARLAGLPTGLCKIYATIIDTTKAEGSRVLGEHFLGTVQIIPKSK